MHVVKEKLRHPSRSIPASAAACKEFHSSVLEQNTVKGISRILTTRRNDENQGSIIANFFIENSCRYEMQENLICWSSPGMKASYKFASDLMGLDATHSIPGIWYRGKRTKAKLFVLSTATRE
jgi:hypothetical protein